MGLGWEEPFVSPNVMLHNGHTLELHFDIKLVTIKNVLTDRRRGDLQLLYSYKKKSIFEFQDKVLKCNASTMKSTITFASQDIFFLYISLIALEDTMLLCVLWMFCVHFNSLREKVYNGLGQRATKGGCFKKACSGRYKQHTLECSETGNGCPDVDGCFNWATSPAPLTSAIQVARVLR